MSLHNADIILICIPIFYVFKCLTFSIFIPSNGEKNVLSKEIVLKTASRLFHFSFKVIFKHDSFFKYSPTSI